MDYDIPQSLLHTPFRVDFWVGKDGWWVAKAHDVEGALSQGETLEEARENIRDAIALMIEDYSDEEVRSLLERLREREGHRRTEDLSLA